MDLFVLKQHEFIGRRRNPKMGPLLLLLSLSTVVINAQSEVVHVVVLVGQNVSFDCNTDNTPYVRWEFAATGKPTDTTVYNGNKFTQHLEDRAHVSSLDSTTHRLTIVNVTATDAGIYRCVDLRLRLGSGSQANASLTVLTDSPSCSRSINQNGDFISDNVLIHCEVSLIGELEPKILCQTQQGTPIGLLSYTNAPSTSRVRRMHFTKSLGSDRFNSSTQFMCSTFFTSPNSQDNTFSFTWTSPTLLELGSIGNPTDATSSKSSHDTKMTTIRPVTIPPKTQSTDMWIIVICAVAFTTFLLAVLYIMCRTKVKGVLQTSQNKPDVLPYASSHQLRQMVSDRPVEMYRHPVMEVHDVSGDPDEPVPPLLPARPASNGGTLSSVRTDAGVPMHEQNNNITNNAVSQSSDGFLVYAELSATTRSDRTQAHGDTSQQRLYGNMIAATAATTSPVASDVQ